MPLGALYGTLNHLVGRERIKLNLLHLVEEEVVVEHLLLN
jgi:hypothetical protein